MKLLPDVIRRVVPLALVLPGLILGGCEDDRESTAGPSGFLDGDALFGSALLTASILRYQNDMAARVRDIIRNDLPTPIFEVGCSGDGQRVITRDSQNPNRLTFQHTAFVIDCGTALRLTLNGRMIIEFQEASPGMRYTVSMPFNLLTGETEGMIFQTPSDFAGGAILDVTTPGVTFDPVNDPYGSGGLVDCVLVGGTVQQLGTVRIEERVQGILLVLEIETAYAYDENVTPQFAPWPGGRLEIASLISGGFFGSLTSLPVEIRFDGFGGADFEASGRACQTNMATGTNPCQHI